LSLQLFFGKKKALKSFDRLSFKVQLK
jgi:hypothetical protein